MTQPTPQPRDTPSASRDIVIGATVFGADNARFGQVAGSYRNYLIVERGFFMPIDYYVPMNAVGRVADDLVVLSVSRDAALTQGWERPPFTSETGQRGLQRPTVGRTGGSAASATPSAAPVPASQSDQTGTPAVPGSGGPAAAATGATATAATAADAPTADAAVDTAAIPSADAEEPGPAVAEPAPLPGAGAFADTYAVGTNTDSYQAMTGFPAAAAAEPPTVEPGTPGPGPILDAPAPTVPPSATPPAGQTDGADNDADSGSGLDGATRRGTT